MCALVTCKSDVLWLRAAVGASGHVDGGRYLGASQWAQSLDTSGSGQLYIAIPAPLSLAAAAAQPSPREKGLGIARFWLCQNPSRLAALGRQPWHRQTRRPGEEEGCGAGSAPNWEQFRPHRYAACAFRTEMNGRVQGCHAGQWQQE